MGMTLLDNPFVTETLFFPRGADMQPANDDFIDGTIPIDEKVKLGYRFYLHQPGQPVIVFFHGNGEIAADYVDIADWFREIGAALLVVDFRGYGWGTGIAKASNILSDMEAVHQALPAILKSAGYEQSPLFIMGRSLGSASAIHMAHLYPATFRGIIIESGFAHIIHLIVRRGFPADILGDKGDPIGNVRKIKAMDKPLLVIHGEQDQLIPVTHGQDLYEASPSAHKVILRIPGAGHNDLMWVGKLTYFEAIGRFIHQP